ncbi:MAG: DUF362 domain-containing protein [Candidatus Kariarchaeaceae archaeon]|jgi:uncharacterized Fe-S center protein
MSKVFMVNTNHLGIGDSLIARFIRLWNHPEVKLDDWIEEGDIVVIKTHFGSKGQTRHLRPMYVRKAVDLVRKAGGIPWVAECVGLGWSSGSPELTMAIGPAFQTLANRHGFNDGSMNAPIVMLDGVAGVDTFSVPIDNGKYMQNAAVAMGLKMADKILVLSHFKGHGGAGFGGALKQLGIGMVGVEGKGGAHFGGAENIYVKNPEQCDGCTKCLRMCPTNCLSLDENNVITLDSSRCIACIHCFDVCHQGKGPDERVFALRKSVPSLEQVERMMDNASGVVKGIGEDRLRYINIAIDITSRCDCESTGAHLLVADQGILYSKDPIAVDQASVDLVTKAEGVPESPAMTGVKGARDGDIEPIPEAMKADSPKLGLFAALSEPDARPHLAETQLTHASKLGLGSRDYEMVDVTFEKPDETK